MTNEPVPAQAPRSSMPARFDIFEPLNRIRSEFDRIFDDFTARPGTAPLARRMFGTDLPPLAMTQTDGGYKLTAELPGLEPANVEITVTDQSIRIAGEKKESREEKERDCFVSERRYGAFERVIELPADVDRDSIAASFKNGVLTLEMKRDAKAQPAEKKIEIKSA